METRNSVHWFLKNHLGKRILVHGVAVGGEKISWGKDNEIWACIQQGIPAAITEWTLPLHRLWGGPRSGSLEHRMAESSSPAEALAPRIDLEGTVDFMKNEGVFLLKWLVKATGPLLLTGGHRDETVREQIQEDGAVSYSWVPLADGFSGPPFAAGAVWSQYLRPSSSLKLRTSWRWRMTQTSQKRKSLSAGQKRVLRSMSPNTLPKRVRSPQISS